MLWFVLTSLAVGLPVAVAARAVLPGPRPLTLPTATVLAVVGAFAGALLARVLLGEAGSVVHPLRRELVGPLLGSAVTVLVGWGARAHTYHSGPRPPRPRPWAEPVDTPPRPASQRDPGAEVSASLEDNVP